MSDDKELPRLDEMLEELSAAVVEDDSEYDVPAEWRDPVFKNGYDLGYHDGWTHGGYHSVNDYVLAEHRKETVIPSPRTVSDAETLRDAARRLRKYDESWAVSTADGLEHFAALIEDEQ